MIRVWLGAPVAIFLAHVGLAAQDSRPAPLRDVGGVAHEPDATKKRVAGVRVSLYRNNMRRDSVELLADGKTDAEGKFRFRGIPWVEGPDWGFNTIVVLATLGQRVGMREVRGGRVDLDNVAVELLPTLTLHGTLVGAQDRKPIPNARVWPYVFGDVRGGGKRLAWVSAPLPQWYATTDAEGKFSLVGLPSMEKLHLHAEHEDFARSMFEVEELAKPCTLELIPGGRISGRVLLPDGKPAVRVTVRASGNGSGYGWTVCDEDGRFCLRSLATDLYKVWAEAPDLTVVAADGLDVTPAKSITGIEVRLVRGGFICGTILDGKTGRPVKAEEGVDVAMYGPARPRGGACECTPVLADGTFRIRAPAGKNLIYLRALDGYEEKSETVEVEEGKETKVVWRVAPMR